MKRWLAGLMIGLIAGGVIGFGAGIYSLPILIEWWSKNEELTTVPTFAETDPTGAFDRNSPGSDALHWGEGKIRLSDGKLVFEDDVTLAPGPDYRIYMTTKFVDNRDDFKRIKPQAIEISKLRVFSGPLEFDLPPEFNATEFDNVIVWCEAFSMYIASARLD